MHNIVYRFQFSLYCFLLTLPILAQQQGDTTQFFTIPHPTYPAADGPIVFLDGGYNNFTILLPEVAWEFTDDTPFYTGENWHQLAILNYGQGKVVFGGEAAMFSAQVAGRRKIGMNSPQAPHNLQLLRNILAWLVD